MDTAQMKIGSPVYVVVRLSKYLIDIHAGMVIGFDEYTICYSQDGIVRFAQLPMCFPNRVSAENKKLELERQG